MQLKHPVEYPVFIFGRNSKRNTKQIYDCPGFLDTLFKLVMTARLLIPIIFFLTNIMGQSHVIDLKVTVI
jgi:hypothetical protein